MHPIRQWDISPLARISPEWDNSHMAGVVDRVREALQEAGLDPKNASLKAGLNETYIRDLYKSKSKSPNLDNMRKLGQVVGKTGEELLYGPESPEARAAKLLKMHTEMDATQQSMLLRFAGLLLSGDEPGAQPPGPGESAGIVTTRATEQPVDAVEGRRRVRR